MGDMGDDFRAMREHKKDKRLSNTEHSTYLLIESSINFEMKNGGAHLIVRFLGNDGVRHIDFWPSTGLWIPRGGIKQHRGVKGLINYVKKHTSAS